MVFQRHDGQLQDLQAPPKVGLVAFSLCSSHHEHHPPRGNRLRRDPRVIGVPYSRVRDPFSRLGRLPLAYPIGRWAIHGPLEPGGDSPYESMNRWSAVARLVGTKGCSASGRSARPAVIWFMRAVFGPGKRPSSPSSSSSSPLGDQTTTSSYRSSARGLTAAPGHRSAGVSLRAAHGRRVVVAARCAQPLG